MSFRKFGVLNISYYYIENFVSTYLSGMNSKIKRVPTLHTFCKCFASKHQMINKVKDLTEL